MFAHFVTQDSSTKGETVPQLPNPLYPPSPYFSPLSAQKSSMRGNKGLKQATRRGRREGPEWRATRPDTSFSSTACLWGSSYHCYIPFEPGAVSVN